jgi:hypothetical protein
MPTARSNAQCPYCDHLSPVGSKFCNDCGAALHLRPCPHCGSVNDVTLNTHCSRCNGDLGFAEHDSPAAEETEPEQVQLSAVLEPPPSSPPAFAADNAASLTQPAKPSRAPLIGFALLALAAAAYFGWRNDPAPAQRVAHIEARPDTGVIDKPTIVRPAASAPEQVASAPEPAESKEAAAAPAFAASLAKLNPPGAGRPSSRREAAMAPATAAASPAAERNSYSVRPPSEGLDLKQPNIGSCTDAVAALGLCTQESNPRRP